MSKARELANLLEADGDVISAGLDNVPASDWTTLLNKPAHADTDTRDASNINTGTLPNARIVDLPNAQVAGLVASATTDTTSADNISIGTLNVARMGSGTGGSGNYLRGDGAWTTNCTNHGNCTNCSGTDSFGNCATNGNGMANCANCSGTSSHTNCTNCAGTLTSASGSANNTYGGTLSVVGTAVVLTPGVCACNC